jgi:hypothetical protein
MLRAIIFQVCAQIKNVFKREELATGCAAETLFKSSF